MDANITIAATNETVCSMILNQLTVEARRGSRPILRPAEETRQHHRQMRLLQDGIPAMSQQFMCVIPNAIYPSKNPFSKLARIRMTDLVLETPVIGKYLLLRTIEPGFVMVSWHTVVEDHTGNVCVLSLYNYPEEDRFPVGSVIILKEPYFKKSTSGMQSLRSDCPTDVIVLRKSSRLYSLAENIVWKNSIIEVADPLYTLPIPITPVKWKARGNALYNNQQYILAGEAYTLGLKLCKESDDIWRVLQLNVAAVLLTLGYYEKCIATTEKVLKLYPNDVKVLLRAGKCHYILREYKEALKKFERARNVNDTNAEMIVELKKTRQRISEQETGYVDLEKLKSDCLMSPMTKIAHADYMGPVKVINIADKDRGVVVTEDVPAGKLLMISKAISSSFGLDDNSKLKFDFQNFTIGGKNVMKVITEVAHIVTKNPKIFGSLIYNLSEGVIPRREVQVFCDPDTKDEPISDVGKINAICHCNAFSIHNVFNGFKEGSGLFILPSYLNHSCVPNAKFVTYNDVMLVHTVKEIKAGDEVCISYVHQGLSPINRMKLLKEKLQKCFCPKCKPGPMNSKKGKTFSRK